MLPFNIVILSENKTSLIVILPPPLFFCHVERNEISPTNSKINKQKKAKIHKTATFTKKKKQKFNFFMLEFALHLL